MSRRRRNVWSNPFGVGLTVAALAAAAAWRNTDFAAPPRFDGAGYAVLAESLRTGRGYRGIDHPDAPRHAHFPPGYPAALALVWGAAGGRSVAWAHAFSAACTVAATLAAWRWFRTMYGPRTAGLLGLALAANWAWGRAAGSIQSEPLFFLAAQLALLATAHAARRGGAGSGLALGLLLGTATLTRQVGAALAAAALTTLLWKGRKATARAAALTFAALTLPWVAWLASVRENTQATLVGRGGEGLARLIASQAGFYLQRLPDQLSGPFVEVGTVFRTSPATRAALNVSAALATALFVLGWVRAVSTPRRRAAGLTALVTLALLLVWPFTEAGRFLVPLVPCLLVGAVEGLAAVLVRGRPGLRRPRAMAATTLLVVSVPYSAYSLWADRATAQRRTHAGFDAACAWIAGQRDRPGPVLTRHPGEVFWQTGRLALAPESDDPETTAREINRRRVAFLLVDDERYANAPANPLARFVAGAGLREAWSRETGQSAVRVYDVTPRDE